MMRYKHSITVLLILFSFALYSLTPPGGTNGVGLRIYAGPAFGFYQLYSKHAEKASPRMGGSVGFKKEIRCDKMHKVFFLCGAEYFFHGVNFRSYYFDQDTLQLYNKDFAFDYAVFIQELNVPLQVKFSLTRENNSLYSPYILLGYHLRYMLPSHVMISQVGNSVKDAWEMMRFKTPMLMDQMNSFMSVSIGWQKNTVNNSKSGFFVEAYFKYGFSQYSFKSNYAPSSLFLNGMHAGLNLGVKF